MTEADYEFECDRAELLGLPIPPREEFFSRQRQVVHIGNLDEILAEELEAELFTRESLQEIRGGLEELNVTLCNTQTKLNKVKTACENFSNFLKVRISIRGGIEFDPTLREGTLFRRRENVADAEEAVRTESPAAAVAAAAPAEGSGSGGGGGAEQSGAPSREGSAQLVCSEQGNGKMLS